MDSCVPSGWRLGTLGDIADSRVDLWQPTSSDIKPYVALEHIAQGSPTLLGYARSSEATSTKAVFRKGDLLFGKLRPNLRKAVLAPFDGICSTDILVIRARRDSDPGYLECLAHYPPVQEHAVSTASGTKMPRTSWPSLKSCVVPIPPLAEQRKIAAILSSVDESIEKTEAVIAQLDVVKKAMLEELLTRGIPGRHSQFKQTEIGEVPEEWTIRPLGELVDFINGRAFSERDWKRAGVPIIRIQNLNGGTEFNYFQGEVEDRFAVRPNDLLFSWSGTRGTSFGPHVWRGPTGVLNQHIFNVKNLRGVTQDYLLWALRFITSRIEKAAHGGSGLVHITKGALEQFRVPVPDASEQTAIADRLQAIDEAKRATDQELTARQNLKSSLAEALLSGTVRTTGGSAA